MKKINDAKNYNFDVIILAGQSNAQGNGSCPAEKKYHNDDVLELDENSLTLYGYGSLDYSSECDFEIKYAEYRKNDFRRLADFSESFADCYIADGLLNANRKILIVKSAVGGTGFSLSQWGVGNPLHTRLKDMINYALSLNPNNKLKAFLWHQGEHDAYEQPELSTTDREKFYYDSLKKTIDDIRESFNVPDLPVVTGEMVNDWADKNKQNTSVIENATKRVCADVGFAGTASSDGLLSNAQTIEGNPDDIHFCADSIEELGKRYFAIYKNIISANK